MDQSDLSECVLNRIQKHKDEVAEDHYRMHYHIMPPIGLLNDPNGFVFFKGCYHIFYQWNPFETKHGSKYWGHYVSDDLVHWEAAPFALAPDQWFDKDGCYSGSAIVKDEKLYVFYTGNVKNDKGERESYQCLAVSSDGIHFTKRGPIIHVPEGYTAHFRDPKVFYREGKWYLVIGAQTKECRGEVVIYSSSDFEEWTFHGALTGSGRNGLGEFGYMWECPDLFKLNDKDILMVSPQGLQPKGYEYHNIYQAGYVSGKVDYTNMAFEHGPFTEMDRGFDFYAPQTALDNSGRRLLFGWMGNAEEEESKHPTIENQWVHTLTIPRYLTWHNGKLLQNPVPELKKLRKNEITYTDVNISDSGIELENVNGNVFEMQVMIKEWTNTKFSIVIGNDSKLIYDEKSSTFTYQRRSFDKKTIESRQCYLEELKRIQLFKDTSSIEIFINEGEEVFSSRVFDKPGASDIIFYSSEPISIDVKKWDLSKVCY